MIARASARLIITIVLASTAASQVTQRVTLSSAGGEGDGISYAPYSISPDGRYVSFDSHATNLVPGDTNSVEDSFLRDRVAGTTERISVGPGGVQANGPSSGCLVTPDGRFVAFSSYASNLVPGDANGCLDAFVRDRALGTTERVSVSSGGIEGDDTIGLASITPDGRYVGLSGWATNLVPGDTNGQSDVFVHDRWNQTTERVSLDSNGAEGAGGSHRSSLSDDGRFVAFVSHANNLVPLDTNNSVDVFVRDRIAGTTQWVSAGANALPPTIFWAEGAQISGNGRYVAFSHDAHNLVPGDTNGVPDIFVRDLVLGTTERVNVGPTGLQADDRSWAQPSISTDGRFVAFGSYANNLVVGDTNYTPDVFVRDRLLGTTERVSVGASGEQLTGYSGFGGMSSNGRFVTFNNPFSFLPDDTNGKADGYVRQRWGGTRFSSLCDPGSGGVIPCPCGNPPGGPGRGCDNSAATGGAVLSASGGAFLSSDSLVFTTSHERPVSLSLLLQGSAALPTGAIHGQGVRCTGGGLERLFIRQAAAGGISVPDFAAGDTSVSARSGALGDSISPGQSRWYAVYYRDAVVLGGCPATSTFNATQTGVVLWAP